MKATGIVRRIDDLGRVVIPKEIRRTLRIREGDPLEIFTAREGEIILKKYSPIGELNEFANEFCESLYENTNYTAIISDRDNIIAIAGGSKKEYLEKRVSPELERVIESRNTHIVDETTKAIRLYYEDEDPEEYRSQVISPIVMQGDPIGSVILMSKEADKTIGEIEVKLVETAASFLAKQMEN
ncbi:MAG: stage V sporulation protein T [Tissierellia bacterium]|nr:stage V sporulation protein T [Tissierellia bacterium]